MFERQIKIPEPEELKAEQPMSAALAKIKQERDKAVADVICGKSDKMIIIVGPCSAHAEKPVLDYVERLGRLTLNVSDELVIVPPIYTN